MLQHQTHRMRREPEPGGVGIVLVSWDIYEDRGQHSSVMWSLEPVQGTQQKCCQQLGLGFRGHTATALEIDSPTPSSL
ncbi:hypothetical protein GN956_G10116 [Arapaima gigas]